MREKRSNKTQRQKQPVQQEPYYTRNNKKQKQPVQQEPYYEVIQKQAPPTVQRRARVQKQQQQQILLPPSLQAPPLAQRRAQRQGPIAVVDTAHCGRFQQYRDPEVEGATYYYNPDTGEAIWFIPEPQCGQIKQKKLI
jgi:hypothetical protein